MRGLIALLALLTVTVGCDRAQQPEAVDDGMTGWESIDAARIVVPDGVNFTVASTEEGSIATISGVPQDAMSADTTGGVGVAMPEGFEAQASGQRIRVTTRAYSDVADANLGVAYSTNEIGNSDWRRFPLTTEPADYTFEYDVRTMVSGRGDYIGFRDYEGRPVHVVSYKVEVLGPSAPPAAPAAGQ